MWDPPKSDAITTEQVEEFCEKLRGFSPACENYMKMSRSVQMTYIRWYWSSKNGDTRQRNFEKIVDRLNQNLKPM
jgi:uncharacterized protein YdeI (YjbR/CyaY-like superfamily)